MKRSFTEVTRFLGGQELADQDLWKIVKPHVRRIQTDDGILILNDTVEEKPYSDESELVNWLRWKRVSTDSTTLSIVASKGSIWFLLSI